MTNTTRGVNPVQTTPKDPAVADAPAFAGRRFALLAGSSLLLTGCLATKGGLSTQSMAVVPMQSATVMPKIDPDNLHRRTRVVVMQPQESASSRGAGLPEVATAALEGLLGKGGVEIIDRKLAGRLDEEIKRIEMSSSSASASYAGPDVADYAVSVVLSNASWGSQFSPASTSTDKKTGKVYVTPASHTHSGRSKLAVRVYELPSMRLVLTHECDGAVSRGSQQVAAGPAQATQLMRDATADALNDAKGPVLNLFAPKGYVTERRQHEKVSYFRTTLGKRTGVTKGQTVQIFTLEQSTDPLTKRTTTAEVLLVEGEVSDQISDEHSFVVIDDEKRAAKVRMGDIVRTKFDPTWLEKTGRVFNRLGF